MKIVRFSSFGVPHEVARCEDADDPGAPAADEVVVEVEAFPINPVDLLTLEGRYAVRPALPAIPGSEGVGRVTACGSAVGHVRPGDRVLLLGRETWMEKKRIKGEEALKLPEDAELLQLAMLKINPATALLMLRTVVALQPGDWVIQDAANSGVGHNLIRLAQAEGLRTVNVVRRDSVVRHLKAIGADVVVVDGPDLARRVAAETGGAEIRLAVDAVAGETCLGLADCLADGGTVVNYGLLSGEPCMLRPEQLIFRGLTLTGFWLVRHLGRMSPEEKARLYGELARRVADGTVFVPVEATYPIADIKAALAHAARAGRDGKILVTPREAPAHEIAAAERPDA